MHDLNKLIQNNREWAEEMIRLDPEFFAKREGTQQPNFLMIGCSDSRVPLEMMTGALPGEMFVHRNIGNQVWSTDINVLAVLDFAVRVLDVKHIIVCGHSNCGALKAALGGRASGVLDYWLADIRNTVRWHEKELNACADDASRLRLLSRLNVIQQVGLLSRTPTVLDAWSRGRRPLIHGWVFDIGNGLVEPVVENIAGVDEASERLPRS